MAKFTIEVRRRQNRSQAACVDFKPTQLRICRTKHGEGPNKEVTIEFKRPDDDNDLAGDVRIKFQKPEMVKETPQDWIGLSKGSSQIFTIGPVGIKRNEDNPCSFDSQEETPYRKIIKIDHDPHDVYTEGWHTEWHIEC